MFLCARMDTRTRSASPNPCDSAHTPTQQLQDKISAYYSLVFPHFTFYIQTLSITVGRRCSPNPNAATSSTAEHHTVDVDLGALKSVSRLHAKIEYDQDEDRFVLVVIGRNGAWVDGVWSGAGTRAPLGERYVGSRMHLLLRLLSGSVADVPAQTLQVPDSNRISHIPFCPAPTSSTRGYAFAQLPVFCKSSKVAFSRHHLHIATVVTALPLAHS